MSWPAHNVSLLVSTFWKLPSQSYVESTDTQMPSQSAGMTTWDAAGRSRSTQRAGRGDASSALANTTDASTMSKETRSRRDMNTPLLFESAETQERRRHVRLEGI